MTMTPPLPAELARGQAAFVGRRDELAALEGAWRAAQSGSRQVAFVSGDPGIGKTRLVGELAAAAHRDGAVVLHGHCDPEVLLPYQPFVECFRQLAGVDDEELAGFVLDRRRSLSRVLPELAHAGDDAVGDGDGASERARLFGACAALLRFIAEREPVLLAIDDLHWAGAPTIQLLRHLVHAVEGLPVLFAATYRDTEVGRDGALGALLADLRTEGGIERLSLGGLEVDDVADLAVAAAGASASSEPSNELVRVIHADTAGNPFFVTEVLRHLVDTGALRTGDDGWQLIGPLTASGLPDRVRDVLALRLAALPDATRRHLASAAIIGPAFDLAVLAALDLGGDALDAVEPAVAARLVTEVSGPVGRFRFAHALVRQALLDELSASRRARLHEHVGLALEATGAPDADVAHHLLASGRDELIERGARLALAAAESFTWRSAPEAAIEILANAERALAEVVGHDLFLEVDLLCEHAMALVVVQRNAEFLAVAQKAVKVARATGSNEAFAQAAATRACYTPTGNTDEAFITDLEEALEVVDGSELALRSRLHTGIAVGLVIMAGDRFQALDHANEGAVLADRSGVLFERWMARFAGALAAACGPGLADLARMGAELEAIGDECDDENARCHGLHVAATARLAQGDLDGYLATVVDCSRRWAAIQNAWGVLMGIVARYVESAGRGRFEEAEACLDELLGVGGLDPNMAAVYAGQLIMLRELQGRLAEIEPIIDMSATAYPAILSLRIVDALALIELGRVEEAREIARATLTSPAMANRDFMELSRHAWGVQLAVELGDKELVAPLYERLREWAGLVLVVNNAVALLGRVDAYLGLAAAALGDAAAADAHFGAALEWEEATGCRPFAARTRFWWAKAIATRDPGHAASLLDGCVALAEEIGNETLAAHARALRAGLGAP